MKTQSVHYFSIKLEDLFKELLAFAHDTTRYVQKQNVLDRFENDVMCHLTSVAILTQYLEYETFERVFYITKQPSLINDCIDKSVFINRIILKRIIAGTNPTKNSNFYHFMQNLRIFP